MKKMSFVIDERLEKRLREAAGTYFGVRKGAISEALGQAIEVWLDFKSQQSRATKAKVGWSGKDKD
jgi:hypothetical protein